MKRLLLAILLIALPSTAQTLGSWNGKTVGTSAGNIGKWNNVTLGTTAGNIGKWNNLHHHCSIHRGRTRAWLDNLRRQRKHPLQCIGWVFWFLDCANCRHCELWGNRRFDGGNV